jgi:hypothetical protein
VGAGAGAGSGSLTPGRTHSPSKPGSPGSPSITSALALDCEMVGAGPEGARSILARCSIVNWSGQVVYDKFVKPTEEVTGAP